jgi:hypothetical protein
MVRRDDTSLARMREAEDLFNGVASQAPEQIAVGVVQAWQLACRGNDPERRIEAAALCAHLLRAQPEFPAPIIWAVARALPVELQRSRQRIEALIEGGRADVVQAVALVTMHLSEGRPGRALRSLADCRVLFDRVGADHLIKSLQAQANLANGAVVAPAPSIAEALRLLLMKLDRQQADQAAEEEAARLAAEGRSIEGQTGNVVECLIRLAQRSLWDLVVPFAVYLKQTVGTADAIRLAAFAYFNTNDPRTTLELLSEEVNAFPSGRLPPDLHRLRVQCLQQTGQVTTAISEAAELARASQDRTDLLALADLHLRTGNLREASVLVSQAREIGPFPASLALRYARFLSDESPELGRTLWREAVAGQLEDQELGIAIEAAHRLRLENETRPIMARLSEVAARGSQIVRAIQLSDLEGFLRERLENLEQLSRSHSDAILPAHLYAAGVNANLGQLYHADLEAREQDHTVSGALLARHGGRGWPRRKQLPRTPSDVRLSADVTALLLAHHLDILDSVERLFRPLRLSQHAPPVLIKMRDMAVPHDPARIDEFEALLTMISAGRIETITPPPALAAAPSVSDRTTETAIWLAERAAEHDGVLVDWTGPDGNVPANLAARITNCRGLIGALRRSGELRDFEIEQVLSRLGTIAEEQPLSVEIQRGQPIYFHSNTISTMILSGVMEPMLQNHRGIVDSRFADAGKSELAAARRGRELAAWIDRLLQRVTSGIHDGTYQFLPMSPSPTSPDEEETVAGLRDLLREAVQPGDVIWADAVYHFLRQRRHHAYCGHPRRPQGAIGL